MNILYYTHNRVSLQDKVFPKRHYLTGEGMAISLSASRTFLTHEPAVWLLECWYWERYHTASVCHTMFAQRSRDFISVCFWQYSLQLSFV